MTNESRDPRPIVVGVDGSEGAQVALRWAVREAALRGAPLEVVHVWSPPAPVSGLGSIMYPLDVVPFEQAAKQLLAEAIHDVVADTGAVRVEGKVVRGHPSTVLLDAAEKAQLLVVGTRGLGGFRGLLLGSVSQQCVHHLRGVVVIVPPDVIDAA